MSQAVICPICGGSGKCFVPPPKGSSATGGERTCHGCDGKGWVEIGQEYPTYIPYPYPNYSAIII